MSFNLNAPQLTNYSSAWTSLTEADTAAIADGAILVIDKIWSLPGDTTLSSPFITFNGAGRIATNGHTLTIGGSLDRQPEMQYFDISGGGGIIVPSGTYFSIRYLGAGLGSDDGPLFAAANAISSQVHVPAGQYVIVGSTSTVTMASGTEFYGDGDASVIVATTTVDANSATCFVMNDDCILRSMKFIPAGNSPATGVVRSVITVVGDRTLCSSLRFIGSGVSSRFAQHVIGVQNVSSARQYTVYQTKVDDCDFTWCSNIFAEESGYTANDSQITNCRVWTTNGSFIIFNGGRLTADNSGVCTISIASPAVITFNNNYTAGMPVEFSTTGALPTGLSTATQYYVISAGLSATQFRVSTTVGGSAVNTSGSQSGVQSVGVTRPPTIGAVISNNIARDVGFAGDPTGTTFGAEKRFLGATKFDNFTVTGNLLDHVWGDAPIHFERPGNGQITNNTFRNCHGSLALAIWFAPAATAGYTDPEMNLTIANNSFELADSAVAAGNDAVEVVATISANSTRVNLTHTGNTYEWWLSYPATPSASAVTTAGIRALSLRSFTGPVVSYGNRYLNFLNGAYFSGGGSHLHSVTREFFRNCATGIVTGSLDAAFDELLSCEFYNCATPVNLDTSNLPRRMGNLRIFNSTTSTFNFISPNYLSNTYTGTNTTVNDPISADVTIPNTGAGTWTTTNVGTFNGRQWGIMNIRITHAGGNTSTQSFQYGWRTSGQFAATAIATANPSGSSFPTISLTEASGVLKIGLAGTSQTDDYLARFSFSGTTEE